MVAWRFGGGIIAFRELGVIRGIGGFMFLAHSSRDGAGSYRVKMVTSKTFKKN